MSDWGYESEGLNLHKDEVSSFREFSRRKDGKVEISDNPRVVLLMYISGMNTV